MSIWNSRQEILDEIRDTKAEIRSRRGVSRYMLSTGMGTQSADNRTLKELQDYLRNLESALGDFDGDGIVSIDFPRTIGGV